MTTAFGLLELAKIEDFPSNAFCDTRNEPEDYAVKLTVQTYGPSGMQTKLKRVLFSVNNKVRTIS